MPKKIVRYLKRSGYLVYPKKKKKKKRDSLNFFFDQLYTINQIILSSVGNLRKEYLKRITFCLKTWVLFLISCWGANTSKFLLMKSFKDRKNIKEGNTFLLWEMLMNVLRVLV